MTKKEKPYDLVCEDIAVHVTPKRMRRLRLRVLSPDGRVEMSVPFGTPRAHAEKMVTDHLAWIRKHRLLIKAKPENKGLPGDDGARLRLFGEEVTLVFGYGKRGAHRVGNTLYIGVNTNADTAARVARVEKYLHDTLKERIAAEMPALAARVGKEPSSWYIRKMKTRWGTCNTRTGRICLNLNLVHYPAECLSYVIIHELCHLHVAGHNDAFWRLVKAHCPTYEAARGRLKKQ